MKIIEIMNYADKKAEVKIKKFDDVVRLTIEVVTGDEILHILYKDYHEEIYDSCYMLDGVRFNDYFDNGYVIYDITKNINYIDEWSKRKNSYDFDVYDFDVKD